MRLGSVRTLCADASVVEDARHLAAVLCRKPLRPDIIGSGKYIIQELCAMFPEPPAEE